MPLVPFIAILAGVAIASLWPLTRRSSQVSAGHLLFVVALWMAGRESGYNTLDAIRATESYLRVPATTKVGLSGYSGGFVLGGHLREHAAGELERALADASGFEDALADTGHLAGGGQGLDWHPGHDFGRQHSNRIAADIDRGVARHKKHHNVPAIWMIEARQAPWRGLSVCRVEIRLVARHATQSAPL